MWIEIITYFQDLIGAIIIILLAKLLPSSEKRHFDTIYNFEELHKKYLKFDWLVCFILMVMLPLVAYVFHYFITLIIPLFDTKHKEYLYFIRTEDLSWWLAGCIILSFTNQIMQLFLRLILGKNDVYMLDVYTTMRYGSDTKRLAKEWVMFFGIISVILCQFANDAYFGVKENEIEFNLFLHSKHEKYSFDQIKRIICRVEAKPYCIVYFKDNNSWSTQTVPYNHPKLNEIINYLSVQSKIKIDSLHF